MRKFIYSLIILAVVAIGVVFYLWWQGGSTIDLKSSNIKFSPLPSKTSQDYKQIFSSENLSASPSQYQPPADNAVIRFPVFNYHHLGPLPENADENRKAFTVTPEIFEQQLKYFKENGYQAVYLDQLIEYFDSGKPLPEKAIAITFDDSYKEQYQYAFPLLKKYGFVATFFVITSWVGRADAFSWAQIKEMSEAGMAVGSHSVTHPHLDTLSDEDLKNEVENSKKVLEENLGKTIDFIAYPAGFYNDKVIQAVKNAGYIGAVGVYKIISQSPKYRWSIRRFHVDNNLESVTEKLIDYN